MTDKPTPWEILQRPFPANEIGKLPRVTCKDCSGKTSICTKHLKQKCNECNNWISTAHIHLDYVGHAEATRRFLEADPEWTWEPMAVTEQGLPAFDRDGGLWIQLTIAGVTRFGYGDAQGKAGPNAIKEAIGDALRNASMRFGVALDLWSKVERDENHPETATAAAAPPVAKASATQDSRGAQSTQNRNVRKPPTKPTQNIVEKLEATFTPASESMRRSLLYRAKREGLNDTALSEFMQTNVNKQIDDANLSVDDVNKLLALLADKERPF